jgi:hypothetical protein
MCFLKVIAADLIAGDMRSDGQDRNPASVTIVQTIDQVEITWPATPGAHCQRSCEMCFCPSRERGDFLVTHVDPTDVLAGANGVRDPIEGISSDAKNPLYAG